MASCAATRSTPVVSSVTVCSTWMRGFTSRKTNSSPATRNSTVASPRRPTLAHNRAAA